MLRKERKRSRESTCDENAASGTTNAQSGENATTVRKQMNLYICAYQTYKGLITNLKLNLVQPGFDYTCIMYTPNFLKIRCVS